MASPLPAEPDPDDCRCLCGSLVARWVEGAVELKCRRCKRTLRVSLDSATPVGGRAVVEEVR